MTRMAADAGACPSADATSASAAHGVGARCSARDADRRTATRGPDHRHATHSDQRDDVGRRARRHDREHVEQIRSRLDDRIDGVGDHPAADTPAVQRDAHDRADAHRVRERVGNRVVEGAIDRGDIRENATGSSQEESSPVGLADRPAQLVGVRRRVLPGEAVAFGATEVAVGGGALEDRTAQVEAVDDRRGPHVEHLAHRSFELLGRDLTDVPNVSTMIDTGCATPIAYATWASQRLASPAATTVLAIWRTA